MNAVLVKSGNVLKTNNNQAIDRSLLFSNDGKLNRSAIIEVPYCDNVIPEVIKKIKDNSIDHPSGINMILGRIMQGVNLSIGNVNSITFSYAYNNLFGDLETIIKLIVDSGKDRAFSKETVHQIIFDDLRSIGVINKTLMENIENIIGVIYNEF